jgi:purine-nucleoside phosphorylase
MQTVRETIDRALATVRDRVREAPRVGIVLGSGLGALADDLAGRTAIAYSSIDGMPVSKVAGHAGNLVFGRIEAVPVVAMQGRVHLYEGHPACDVVFGARLMIALGARTVVITNAAGGIDPSFVPGDLMIIDDHLNLTGTSCLVGANDESMGPRFPDMTQAYDAELRTRAGDVARTLGFEAKHGVYAGLLGPTYETPAEVRMLRTLGANAVGMSTVLETVAARHMGARVLGISCITNLAAGLGSGLLTHDEVKETADRVRDRFVGLVRGVVAGL